MPKVSVIIPVYNVQEYLRECLDSIVNQTLKDIEVICVDDGSDDDSLIILQEYSEKDNRFILLQQENKGAGAARNYGMSMATGEYLSFLDSDDFFVATLLEDTYKKAKEENADIVIYRFEKYNQQNKNLISCDYAFHYEFFPNRTFNYKDNKKKIFNSFNPCAWNKLFNKKFVKENKLYFQENKRTNDLYFTSTALACADRIALLDKVLVYYRVGMTTNSQATNYVAPIDFYKALKAIKDFLKYRGIFEDLSFSYYALVVSTCIYNLSNNNALNRMCILKMLKEKGYDELSLDKQAISRIDTIFDYDEATYKFLKRYQKNKFNNSIKCIKERSIKGHVKVSVIIPVYNVEKYISECLDSVVSQSLENIEIICINDGSTDASLEILKKYAEKDKRITIFTQENMGQAVARNIGTENAIGEYLYFLDSDDKIKQDALEILYLLAIKEKLDVLYFDGESFFEDNDLRKKNFIYSDYYKRPNIYQKVTTGANLLHQMLSNKDYRVSPSLHFIKKSFYEENTLYFFPGIIHEDNLFAAQCILSAKRVMHISEVLFLRRVRLGSTITDSKTFAHSYGLFKSAIKLIAFCDTKKFDEFVLQDVSQIICNLLFVSNSVFEKLSKQEKNIVNYLDPMEKELFYRLVNDYRTNNLTIKVPMKRVNFKSDLKRVFQCYKDNGLKVTLVKIKEKLMR